MASPAVATEGEQANRPQCRDSPSASTMSDPEMSACDSGSMSSDSFALCDLEQGTAAPGSCRRCCYVRRRCLCFASALAAITIVLVLCRPHDPYWKVQKMDIDTNKFAAVMTGAVTSKEPLIFTADVEFFNPNVVGTTTEPGTFQVYLGQDVMAHGVTDSCSVGAHSSSVVHATVSLNTDAALSKKILDEVTANKFQLKVVAEVQTVAKVGPLRVKTLARCEILSDTLKVLQTPEDVIVSKTCLYSYGL